jgi:hypothetical protein
MKAFLLTLATVALVGRAALAADAATPAVASNANDCVPGMTAATPDVCSLPGFHWEHTIAYVGHHDDARYEYMLLPNK